MLLDTDDGETIALVGQYLAALNLPSDDLRLTTNKRTFETWLGRRVGSSLGGAYVYLKRHRVHAVLINLPRIERTQPNALRVVVAEELLHMRDHLDGDFRRHAKHGHDRIAHRVAHITGATLEEVRSALVVPTQRPYKYLYRCPACGLEIPRRRTGKWSCGQCSRTYDPRFVMVRAEPPPA